MSARLAVVLCSAFLGGCAGLTQSVSPTPPTYYSLSFTKPPGAQSAGPRTLVLVVNETQAAAGYDSQRIIYVRQPQKIEYFAFNEWVDPPARMLAPLLVSAAESSGAFRAVVSAPGPATGDLRLETELLTLQHEFLSTPSQVRFRLRAYLAEDATRRVVATRDFESVTPAKSDDPYGGVQAAQAAVEDVLRQVAVFCGETAASWRPARASAR